MSILDEIRSIEYDKNRNKLFGIKSAIIWAHSKEGGGTYPLLYIYKPKSISQEDYELLLNKLEINIYK